MQIRTGVIGSEPDDGGRIPEGGPDQMPEKSGGPATCRNEGEVRRKDIRRLRSRSEEEDRGEASAMRGIHGITFIFKLRYGDDS